MTRLLSTTLVIAAVPLLTAPPNKSPAASPESVHSAMYWWGYWVGKKGDQAEGAHYLRSRLPKTLGATVSLVHVNHDLKGLRKLARGLARQAREGRGVVLMFDHLLRKTGDDRCRYTEDDYLHWEERVATVAEKLHTPLADGTVPADALVAIAGFDEANVGFAFLCFLGPANRPNPFAESMRLAELYFPTVPERGQVFKLRVFDEPHPAILQGSNIVFGYHYAPFMQPYNAVTTPYCPSEGVYPGNRLSDGSHAAEDVGALRSFVRRLNGRVGHRLPVVFIPYSNFGGAVENPLVGRAIGCNLETVWHHLRRLSSRRPKSWAGQIRGLLAWQWMGEPAPPAGIGPWVGSEGSPSLRRSGKWIGERLTAERTLPPSTLRRALGGGGGGFVMRSTTCAPVQQFRPAA